MLRPIMGSEPTIFANGVFLIAWAESTIYATDANRLCELKLYINSN